MNRSYPISVPPQSSHALSAVKSANSALPVGESANRERAASRSGVLIINADDWGRNRVATDQTLECALGGTVSSVSAMVFMEDSERAATLAQEAGVDAGLHLNLTTAFSAPGCPASLAQHQQEVAKYLLRSRLSQVMFHPGLVRSFEYAVSAQLDEFRRLYQREPDRVDGHHHMHLCSNVLLTGLLPAGTVARRNFSFQQGEKSLSNRLYRGIVDRILARRHRLTDYFFSLPPFDPQERLQRIFSLARQFAVEVETHPENAQEYRFLTQGEIFTRTGDIKIAPSFAASLTPASTA